MVDYVTLMGADAVQAAGSRISSAAENMRRAADSFVCAVHRLDQVLEEKLARLEALVERIEKAATAKDA